MQIVYMVHIYKHIILFILSSLLTGEDRLSNIVYERNKVRKKSREVHLWKYRQRISLEHLGLILQDINLKERFPILHEFLRVVGCYVVLFAHIKSSFCRNQV